MILGPVIGQLARYIYMHLSIQAFKESRINLSLDEGNKTHDRNTQNRQATYGVASVTYPIPAETNSDCSTSSITPLLVMQLALRPIHVSFGDCPGMWRL